MTEKIERQNWKDVKEFIKFRDDIKGRDRETLRNYWISLKHLLNWAGGTPFPQAARIKTPFQSYIVKAREDTLTHIERAGKPLSIATQTKACNTAKMFYRWAKMKYQTEYRPVTLEWLETLEPSLKSIREGAGIQEAACWAEEDILKVAALTDDDLRIRRLDGMELVELAKTDTGRLDMSLLRAQAAIAFLFLSGMRVSAFLSLPVACVDLEEKTIRQDAKRGVLTKFRKSKVTGIFSLPEYMPAVTRWDKIVREAGSTRWFATLTNWGRIVDDGLLSPEKARGKRNSLVDSMKVVCEIAGVEYKSPHALRHAHGTYGARHARNMKEYKAVSLNLMHSSIAITDAIYANFTDEDNRQILAGMGEPQAQAGLPGNQQAAAGGVGNQQDRLPEGIAALFSDPEVLAALAKAAKKAQEGGQK